MKNKNRRFPALSLAVAAMLIFLNAQPSTASAQTFFVTDEGNNRIMKFDSTGNGTVFADAASGLSEPYGLAFDRSGNLFVANYGNSTIFKFDANGKGTVFANASAGVNGPIGLAFDPNGNLYVANGGTDTILKFDSNGKGTTFASPGWWPFGLAFDAGGNLYASEPGDGKIWKFDSSGHAALFAGGYYPVGIAFGTNGNLYTADAGGDKVEAYDSTGKDLGSFNVNPWRLGSTYGVAFDRNGNLYTTDTDDGSLWKFDWSGNGMAYATNTAMSDPEFIALQPLTAPQLGIALNTDKKVVLRWPAAYSDWVLQTATNLCASLPSIPNWNDCAGSPAVSGGQCLTTNLMNGQAVFYRLRKP